MELLQPIMLWGAAAAIIPVLIHLWYSRKGKPLPWAAMRWLKSKEQQPKRGIKPDHLLLLFLRILILLIVVLLLSRPFFPALEQERELPAIHLVEPDPTLVNEFRFELEQALEKGEELYWMSESLSPVQNLEEAEEIQHQRSALPQFLQEQAETDNLNLYIKPDVDYLNLPLLVSPMEVTLHVSEHAQETSLSPFIAVGEEQYLLLTEQGELEQSATPPQQGEEVFEGPVTYRIDMQDSTEISNIEVSLQAIEAVYGLEFREWDEADQGTVNIWFTDSVPDQVGPNQLVMVPNRFGQTLQPNTYFLPAPILRDENELVRTGRLPEYILEKWLQAVDMGNRDLMVSKGQLEKMFMVSPHHQTRKEANASTWLMVVLCLIIIAERILALRKGI
jgi:hypothetical protein